MPQILRGHPEEEEEKGRQNNVFQAIKTLSYHILKQTGDNFLQVKLKGFCLLSENHVRGAATMDTDYLLTYFLYNSCTAQPTLMHSHTVYA